MLSTNQQTELEILLEIENPSDAIKTRIEILQNIKNRKELNNTDINKLLKECNSYKEFKAELTNIVKNDIISNPTQFSIDDNLLKTLNVSKMFDMLSKTKFTNAIIDVLDILEPYENMNNKFINTLQDKNNLPFIHECFNVFINTTTTQIHLLKEHFTDFSIIIASVDILLLKNYLLLINKISKEFDIPVNYRGLTELFLVFYTEVYAENITNLMADLFKNNHDSKYPLESLDI